MSDQWQHNDSAMRAAAAAQSRPKFKPDGVIQVNEENQVSAPADPHANCACKRPPSPDPVDAGPKDTLCANCGRLYQNHCAESRHCIEPKTGVLMKSRWRPFPEPDRVATDNIRDAALTVNVDGRHYQTYDKIIGLAEGHCERLRDGAVLSVLQTGEMLRVIEVGHNHVHVRRSYGSTPRGRICKFDELAIISIPQEEQREYLPGQRRAELRALARKLLDLAGWTQADLDLLLEETTPAAIGSGHCADIKQGERLSSKLGVRRPKLIHRSGVPPVPEKTNCVSARREPYEISDRPDVDPKREWTSAIWPDAQTRAQADGIPELSFRQLERACWEVLHAQARLAVPSLIAESPVITGPAEKKKWEIFCSQSFPGLW